MKLTYNTKRAKGMTLLELTVVILVLLSLIAILFVGARAWKKGSDRSANILNVRNVQQAVRGHANMRALDVGGACTTNDIFTAADGSGQGYLRTPTPPVTDGGTGPTAYQYLSVVPPIGTLYILNPDLGGEDGEYFYSQSATYTAPADATAAQTGRFPQCADW